MNGAPMTDALFDMDPVVTATTEPGELSAGQRLTLRQKTDIERGMHPLTRARVHQDAARLCGNCRFRTVDDHGGSRRYLKCSYGDGARVTHGAATDIRNWWPGCGNHEFAGSGT